MRFGMLSKDFNGCVVFTVFSEPVSQPLKNSIVPTHERLNLKTYNVDVLIRINLSFKLPRPKLIIFDLS